MNKKKNELVHPQNDGFIEKITPKKTKDNVFLFECPNKKCKSIHFRHAGYVKSMLPFLRSNGEKQIDVVEKQVMICVKCRKAYVWLNEQMYDVSDRIDLKAWEKFEKEAHRATGPGGEC
jgi:hypothetical protein